MAYQPKSYRKFVATAATATLVATAVTPAFAAGFTDVSDRYKEAVDYLVANKITQGVSDTQFGIEQQIKRVDAASMIATALKLDMEKAPDSGFTDVPKRAQGAVNALKAAGIINGKSDTKFGSDDQLTRGEMALILQKAYKLTGSAAHKFTDVAPKYDEAVKALVANGITQGKSDTKFGTADPIKRGEFAIFLYKSEKIKLGVPEVTTVAANTVKNVTTVTASVRGGDEKAEAKVEIFANGNTSAAPAATQMVKPVDGKVTADFQNLPAGNHVAKVTFGESSKQVSFTVAATESKVENVTAVDAKTIKVDFSVALDATSAESVANYKIASDGADNVVTKAKLSEDKKSVTLTLTSNLVNDKQVNVTVAKAIKTEDGKEFAKSDYVTAFIFKDDVKPTVSAVSTPNGDLRIVFGEKLDTTANATVVVGGKEFTVAPTAGEPNVLTIAKADLADKGIEAGKKYDLAVAGAKDLSGNVMDVYLGTVNYETVTDKVAPEFSSVVAKSDQLLNVKFSEELSAAPTITVFKDGQVVAGTNVEVSKDNVSFDVKLPANIFGEDQTQVDLMVQATEFKDLGNNPGVKTSKNITVKKDTVAPTLVSTVFNEDTNQIELKFNEELSAFDATKLKFVNKFTSQEVAVKADGIKIEKDTLYITAKDGADKDISGTFTIYADKGAVKDKAIAENESAAFNTAVTVNRDAARPTVDNVVATKNAITVTYSAEVKGGTASASAANVANYKVDGKALPTGSVITLSADKKTATITLPAGSVEESHTGVLTVSNVEGTNDAKIETVNKLVALIDNKAPELLSAKVDGTNLVVTFSEADLDKVDETDFKVVVNGTTAAAVSGVELSKTNSKQYKLTMNSDVSLATGTVTVSVVDASDITDAANNAIVKGAKVTATR
ncbi:S-layer homology domain-containing protein [Bacillus badius]|uniref:S-layer homology domain-containing protein n=1 Tax=Bacillus badius TaxID=1455 RepID=UPI0005979133|nr:S-layer homology domain-containing protein [Bacillus badius]KIL76506.1 N-acetylmuramoyl-L-alanine amidase [Bacillus badius]